MKKGGLADSPFFRLPPQAAPQAAQSPTQEKPAPKREKPTAIKRKKKPAEKKNTKRDTAIPRHHDTTVATMPPRYHDTIIETVRKAVKEFGKEAATHRFTLEEKKAIADLIYSYKRRGVKTSENEIARIAINFIIKDYEENGENSVLHQALEALNT